MPESSPHVPKRRPPAAPRDHASLAAVGLDRAARAIRKGECGTMAPGEAGSAAGSRQRMCQRRATGAVMPAALACCARWPVRASAWGRDAGAELDARPLVTRRDTGVPVIHSRPPFLHSSIPSFWGSPGSIPSIPSIPSISFSFPQIHYFRSESSDPQIVIVNPVNPSIKTLSSIDRSVRRSIQSDQITRRGSRTTTAGVSSPLSE